MATSATKNRPRRAAGASVAGGIFLVVSGCVTAFLGLSTLYYDQYLRYGEVWVFGPKAMWWGWTFVSLGILSAIAGLAAMSMTRWARVTALAVALGVTALMVIFIVYYPAWVLPVIILNVCAMSAFGIAERSLRRRPLT